MADRPSMPASVWLDRGIPFAWLGVADEYDAPLAHYALVRDMAAAFARCGAKSILFYCNGGQNRSATAAIVAESHLSGTPIADVRRRALTLRADVSRSRDGLSLYHRSMMAHAGLGLPAAARKPA
jgi:hypothetical protein